MNLLTATGALFVYLFNLEPRNISLDVSMANDATNAIVAVTSEPWEVETLARIARWESGLRRNIVDCVVLGKLGERGAFQVMARNHSEQLDLCSSDLSKQARIARDRIRESKKVCESQGIRGSDVLGIYTHGRCIRGNRIAAFRYGDGSKLLSFMKE